MVDDYSFALLYMRSRDSRVDPRTFLVSEYRQYR